MLIFVHFFAVISRRMLYSTCQKSSNFSLFLILVYLLIERMIVMAERKQHKKEIVYKVQPLRSKREVDDLRQALKVHNSTEHSKKLALRNVTLFDFGRKTGLRVSDIVKLKVSDVTSRKREFTVTIREKKTGKERSVWITKELKKELVAYVRSLKLKKTDYLFPSSKRGHHLSTTQVYRFLKDAGKLCGRDDIGSHTMRKTFGRQYYLQTHDIAKLQVIFNHSSPRITLKYIGLQQDEINESISKIKFW